MGDGPAYTRVSSHGLYPNSGLEASFFKIFHDFSLKKRVDMSSHHLNLFSGIQIFIHTKLWVFSLDLACLPPPPLINCWENEKYH